MKTKKTNPIFDGLPKDLKSINSYLGIEKKLFKVMMSDHKHATVKSYVKCDRCKAKMTRRSKLIRELGFKSYEQYASWKKVMQFISSNIKENERTNKDAKSVKKA